VTIAPFADSAPRSRAAAATITAARCGTPRWSQANLRAV
jgi:hypothetical protein